MKIILKLILAATISVSLLSFFSYFYYNLPIHYTSTTGSTDYVWEENKFYSRGTEGFSIGKTDKNGFNNLNVPEKIDILFMGSSQIEGFNVAQENNAVAVLNNLLTDEKLTAYNIGVSGHTLSTCLSNLENAINEFTPNKYIIIETQSFMSQDELNMLSNGSIIEIPSVNDGIIAKLQKIDYLRLLYSQFKSYVASRKNTTPIKNTKTDMEQYKVVLNQIFANVNKHAEEAQCQLIIFMDDALKRTEKGVELTRNDSEYYKIYEECCENNNIIFVDMYEHFARLYTSENKLPHGFFNTKVGTGHLNKYGHETIANVLYKIIREKEEVK